ncbi:MAG: hypothetical protein KAX05_00825 [Bacteroidales bacterium]|nr:hypothetical protein [Bacteroidales bacterium]
MEALAVLPQSGEKGQMWSSYDRKSIYNEETGSHENWGANTDGNHYIRKEGENIVMAEMEGPGGIL